MDASKWEQGKNRFKLPAIKTIFEAKRNPMEKDPRVDQWLKEVYEFGQMNLSETRYKNLRQCILYASYFFWSCKDTYRWEMLVKYNYIMFFLDDHNECPWGDSGRDLVKTKQIWAQTKAALEKVKDKKKFVSMNGFKPYNVYVFIVFETICHDLNDVSANRLLNAMIAYTKGNYDESEKSVVKHKWSSLEEYLKVSTTVVCN